MVFADSFSMLCVPNADTQVMEMRCEMMLKIAIPQSCVLDSRLILGYFFPDQHGFSGAKCVKQEPTQIPLIEMKIMEKRDHNKMRSWSGSEFNSHSLHPLPLPYNIHAQIPLQNPTPLTYTSKNLQDISVCRKH